VMCNRRPYQYSMNNKKRDVAEWENLDNDEEYVQDLRAMGNIEDILRATYERKTKGHGSNAEEGSPFQIWISVEPTTPCATKTSKEVETFNQQVISGRRILIGHGSSGNSNKIISSTSRNQVSRLHRGGSTTKFTM
jgi:hypothetical protein